MVDSLILPGFGIAVLVYWVSLVVYRLCFHPLSKFPGPTLAAITDYWELYHDYIRNEGGYLFFELDFLHEKYGPIVRIRPNEIHVKDSTWMKVLYTGPSDPRDRDPFVTAAIGVPDATIATGPYELHRIRRAAIAPMFSTSAMNDIEPVVQREAEKVFSDMESRGGEVLDMRIYYLAWTTDFISDFIFRNSTKLFWEPEKARAWFLILWEFSRMTPLVKHIPWLVTSALELPLLTWKIFMPRLVPYIRLYQDLLDQATEAHNRYTLIGESEKPSDGLQDIFDTILESDLPPSEKLPKRMANEAYNLLVAGGLSTAKTAFISTFHILANPGVEKRLRAELREAIPDKNNLPDARTLQQLPYLSSVLKETMRIASVVTMRVPMIARHKALKFGDLTIPAGTSIAMTFCKAAMDPEIFPEPRFFRPERWIDGSQKQLDYEHYVLPFGRGSNTCLGKQLAYMQLYVIIAGIFRRVEMELFETTRESDIDIKGGGPLGEPSRKSKGMRVKIKGPSV